MQEIRSSTTDHARACEKLLCDCRWMVSGTPLYTSIDDLNGELAFLGVLPFCASDSVDGFWNMRVSKPFSRRSTEALELLNRLLGGVMIRSLYLPPSLPPSLTVSVSLAFSLSCARALSSSLRLSYNVVWADTQSRKATWMVQAFLNCPLQVRVELQFHKVTRRNTCTNFSR